MSRCYAIPSYVSSYEQGRRRLTCSHSLLRCTSSQIPPLQECLCKAALLQLCHVHRATLLACGVAYASPFPIPLTRVVHVDLEPCGLEDLLQDPCTSWAAIDASLTNAKYINMSVIILHCINFLLNVTQPLLEVLMTHNLCHRLRMLTAVTFCSLRAKPRSREKRPCVYVQLPTLRESKFALNPRRDLIQIFGKASEFLETNVFPRHAIHRDSLQRRRAAAVHGFDLDRH